MPKAVFEQGLKVAIEEFGNIAPNSSTNPHWFQGGRWVPITTDGLPAIQDRVAIIFPAGAAGNRNMNARRPVQGRKWSDGNFAFPVTEDFIGALWYAALGTLSTNSVPSTDAQLASGVPLLEGGGTVTVDLTAQPSDGGAILRFNIQSTSDGGLISISGIDANGRGASEVINFASGGSFYTRNSFSAIGPSSIIITHDSEASAIIDAFQYWEHTFTTGPSNPTLSIEKLGDPTAGAASKSFMYSSMVVQELTLNTPAEQRDGLVTGNVTFEGFPGATCNSTSQMASSSVGPWPSWGLSVTRDSIAWNKVTNATLTVAAGNRNYRAAAGTQNPQGSFFGPREVTGSFDILVDNEEEFNRWLGASSHQMVWNWDTPHKMTSTQNRAMSASMSSAFLENVDVSDDDDAYSLAADFRTIDDANHGTIKVKIINGVPGIAYGNTVN
jgi:hypothetical protein